ncbi:YciC family protein [Marinobacterium arenosum]|uniref:YciC family protein n=1 Tax=Marinobacterium arenosum TaxID=2862496 RepID=UPI0021034267|nr:YciC family protein [Marinobacterium arenosum]MBY4678279.1 hypothetical protein [Marinobacterium arenosum]
MITEYIRQSLFFFRGHLNVIARIQLPFLLLINLFGTLSASDMEPGSPQQQQMLAAMAIANFLLIPLYWGATIAYLGSVVDNQPLSPLNALGRALTRWRSLLLVYMLTGLAAFGGFMLFIVPGIFLLIRLGFADYICVLERQGSMASLRQSWQQTEDYFWTLLKGLAVLFVALSGSEILLELLLDQLFGNSLWTALPLNILFGLLHTLLTVYGFRIYCVMREEQPAPSNPPQ